MCDSNHIMNFFDLIKENEKKLFEIAHYKKGQILFREDDLCEKVGFLNKGQISIVSYSLSGVEVVYNEIEEGGLFGNNLLFSSDRGYRGNVIAKASSEVWFLNRKNLLIILEENSKFLEHYLSFQANFSKTLNFKIKLLSLSSAEERLMYFLKAKGSYTYKTISSLAESLYLSREALSRLISKLVKQNKILKNGKTISLPKR